MGVCCLCIFYTSVGLQPSIWCCSISQQGQQLERRTKHQAEKNKDNPDHSGHFCIYFFFFLTISAYLKKVTVTILLSLSKISWKCPLLTNSNSESHRVGSYRRCSIQVHQVDKKTIQLGWLQLQEGDDITTLGIESGDERKIKAEETANSQPAEEKRKGKYT